MANSNPGFTTGFVPSADAWNSYFAGKVDAVNGSLTGGTIDAAVIGATTPATGKFTTLSFSGTLQFSGTPLVTVSGVNATFAGTIKATSAYLVGANQVVGAQIAGWGTSSGGTRGALAGGSATLAQTSAALAQLLIDLKTHGLIGT